MLYTIFDVETSGLHRGDDILSFTYMLCTEKLNVKRAETLYYWKEGVTQWNEEAYQINHLSKEFLRQHADKYEENLKKMYIVLSYADLVGYNSGWMGTDNLIHGFDYAMCTNFLNRNGYPTPNPRSFTDVMRMYMSTHNGVRHKLTSVYAEYGFADDLADTFCQVYFNEQTGAHSSSFDVCMTALLFSKMYADGVATRSSNAIDMSMDVEEASATTYTLFMDGLTMMVRISDENGDSVVKLYTEFAKENPIMGKKIMEDPSKYLEV